MELFKTGTVTENVHETNENLMIVKEDFPDERHEPIKEFGFRQPFFYGGPVLAYAVLIFFLSSLSTFPEEIPSFFGFDKITHFLEYYFFGCLLCRWFSSTDRYRKRCGALLMTILIGTAYALSDELHQSFVPGRDASLWDALFDAAGVGTGAVTYPLILQLIFPRRSWSRKRGRFEKTSDHND
jgi:VanZ family protein